MIYYYITYIAFVGKYAKLQIERTFYVVGCHFNGSKEEQQQQSKTPTKQLI